MRLKSVARERQEGIPVFLAYRQGRLAPLVSLCMFPELVYESAIQLTRRGGIPSPLAPVCSVLRQTALCFCGCQPRQAQKALLVPPWGQASALDAASRRTLVAQVSGERKQTQGTALSRLGSPSRAVLDANVWPEKATLEFLQRLVGDQCGDWSTIHLSREAMVLHGAYA